MTSSNDAHCIGYHGCSLSNIVSSRNLFCSGAHGCRGDNKHITSTPSSLQPRTTINASENIECDAIKSCYHTIMSSGLEYDIKCNALESCSDSHIQSGHWLECNGPYSCSVSTIIPHPPAPGDQIRFVEGRGFRSLEGALIRPVSGTHLYVELYGYKSARNAHIICDDNVYCLINCMAMSCQDLTVDCSATAVWCKVQAVSYSGTSWCPIGSGGTIIDGTKCPNINIIP
eukprot:351471_1